MLEDVLSAAGRPGAERGCGRRRGRRDRRPLRAVALGWATAVGLVLVAACERGSPPEPGPEAAGGEATAAAPEPSPRHLSPVARRLERPPPGAAEAGAALASIRFARELLEQGRPRAAADSLASVERRVPAAADWLVLARARAAAAAGDTGRVRSLLEGIGEPPSPRAAGSIRVTARDSAGDRAGAARLAVRRAEGAGGARDRSRRLLRAARLYREAGDSAAARTTLRRAARSGRAGSGALEAARRLEELAPLTAEEELIVGRALAGNGIWWRAHPRLRAYLASPRVRGARRDTVLLEYGRALLRAGRYPAAVEAVEGLADGHGGGLGAGALLVEGRARLRYRAPVDGRAALRELVRRHPESPAAGEALAELASRAEADGEVAEARRRWARAARHAESSSEARERLLRSGALAYLARDYGAAAAVFRGLARTDVPSETRQRGVYWLALTRRASGDAAGARELLRATARVDRYSYYGTRALETLGRPLLPSDIPPGPRTPGPLGDELENAVLRVRVAEAVGFDGATEREAERLSEHFRKHRFGRYALAEALIDAGFPLRGVRVGMGIRRDVGRRSLRLLRILYPFPRRGAVRAAARRHPFSPQLLAGLIRQESLFEPEIVSYAGAVGLMQVMPGTGRELARRHGIEGFRTDDLRRPSVNLRLGTAYLAELVERFDGRLPFALAAYNAGPHRVARWQRRPFARNPDVFVEHIPFLQTRHYVKAVLGGSRIYAALYGCGRWEPCLGRRSASGLTTRGDGPVPADAPER